MSLEAGGDTKTAIFPGSAHCEYFQATIELIGKKWTGAILRTLFAGYSRFTEIAEAVPGLSNRLLSERLDEIVAAGLVVARGEVRPVYSLTEKGRDLRAVLSEIETWNRTWASSAG
jgi:DNA-binding HxlR family transcriptional regulator